jgi:endogenous inhibitor of DNA gyrase (YacG/DUF329 family)
LELAASCPTCGHLFADRPYRSHAIYCSTLCRTTALRRRQSAALELLRRRSDALAREADDEVAEIDDEAARLVAA